MIGSLVLAIVALGCEPSRDAGFDEDALDEPRETDDGEVDDAEADDADADGQRWESACDRVLEPVDGDRAQLEDMDALDALEALAETSRIRSALSVPQMADQLEQFDQMVILAPLDDGVPADLADEEAGDEGATEDDVDAGMAPPEAFVGPDDALLLDQLLDAGEMEVADGGVVTVEREDDRVVVERDDAQVEVVCADLQTRDAVIHVLSGEPYDPDVTETTGS